MTERPAPSRRSSEPTDARRRTARSRATRATAFAEGLDAYDRGDFFEAHELLEPAWMGTDDPAERALLQGLIKLAAAYVHDVRGNPAGHRARTSMAPALRLRRSARRRAAPAAGVGLDVDRRSSPTIDRRLADLPPIPTTRRSAPPDLPRRSPMTMPGAVPTIDVTEAERRLREDPARPVLLDVREPDEFAAVRAPGAAAHPDVHVRGAGRRACRPTGRCWSSATSAAGPRRSTGVPHPRRADGRRQRGRRHGRLGARRAARSGAAPLSRGEGDLAG